MTDDTDMTPDAQHHGADQCNALRNTWDRHFLEYIEGIDRTGSWKADGSPSVEHWVAFRFGVSWETATAELRVARVLKELPAIANAYGDGLLSKEKVIYLCSFATPDNDERLADEAQRHSAAYVKRLARFARRIRRAEAAATDKKRKFHMHWDIEHDVLHVNGVLPGADGVLFKRTIERMVGRGEKAADGTWPALAERQADALVHLAASHVEQDPDNGRATIVVHVDARELERDDGIASLEDGPVVSSAVAERLMCDGYVQTVIESADGTPIGIGRRSRVVPKWLERLVRERDRECVCCGSKQTVGSEIHHVKPWSLGGRTDYENLVLVCRRCHRLLHEHGYGLRGAVGVDVHLVKPGGRPVRNRPERLRPDVKARMTGPPTRRERSESVRC